MKLDPALEKFATPSQWEKLKAYAEHGSDRKAGKAIGVHKSAIGIARKAVLAKATRQGYSPDHDMIHPLPDGYKLRGTSTLYDMATGEAKIQWVKSEADKERQFEIIREVVEDLVRGVPRVDPIPAPKMANSDLLTALPVSDHHLGMLSWAPETGADYDLAVAERLLAQAVEYLIQAAPASDRCVLPILGDFLHYDSYETVTPKNKNQLDSDSRFPKIVKAAVRCIRLMVQRCLEKHKHVLLIVQPGNHDPVSSVFLMELMTNLYENEPRVTVDTSPSHYHYFDFGRNLVGVTHGDTAKLPELPLIMATDRPEEWGRTRHRYWWTGHVHHDQVKDVQGCRVESFRVLAPTDAWAAKSGWRSGRDMKAIVLHKEHGEVARHIVNPGMLQ